MKHLNSFLVIAVLMLLAACTAQDNEPITIYPAKSIITLGDDNHSQGIHSRGNSLAVQGETIVAVGELNALKQQFSDQVVQVDGQFKDQVLVPGFINQHDHPWLAAITLSSQVISFEDWDLPHEFFPKATTAEQYMARLKALLARHESQELFFSWGYHKLWHGPLNRAMLDELSPHVPVAIWQRSVHEFIVNTKAMELFGINAELVSGFGEHEQSQIDLEEGRFWEAGLNALSGNFFSHLVKPKAYLNALYMVQNYWHSAGTTLVVEPGGLVNKNLMILQNAVFSQDDAPFHMDYIVDGKTMANEYMDSLIESTEKVRQWGEGMSRFLPKQVKLFADGAMYSQLMKMSDGYLDGHHGEWIMEPEIFKQAFAQYWDAGYQIHVHQNGDAGLDLVLDTLEENLKRAPKADHNTIIVHFGYSRFDQVERVKALGASVSVNPYYPVALGEKYSEVGLGHERAHSLVRLGDLEKAGVTYSLHSDMPMAPGQPLYLMWCAVNRISNDGNPIGQEQRVTPLQALKAVTIDAAKSMGLENKMGSLEVGKLANVTVLKQNPLTVDPMAIKDVAVTATLHKGRVIPLHKGQYQQASVWQLLKVYWHLIWAKFDTEL